MALLFHLPGVTPLDSSGNTMAGALLNFYLTGTTTRTDTYTDDALTVAHANPVVADAGGTFDAIYLDPLVDYKAVLTTSAGAVIDTWDLAVDQHFTTGTFTITYTGFVANPTATARWSKYAQTVTLFLPSGTGTSNATTMTGTGAPAAIFPARAQRGLVRVTDNGVVNEGTASVGTNGVISFSFGPTEAVWTNSGTKQVLSTTITYSLL